MFVFWLNNCEATCELLIQAVNGIAERDAVKMLCAKYGELAVSTPLANNFHTIYNLRCQEFY